MSGHFHRELEEIKTLILRMGGMVEESIRQAGTALKKCDSETATIVIEKDDDIDWLEVRIEEECLKTLALYTPVAEDLRLICTIMKINNEFERMADLAANICKRVRTLAKQGAVTAVPEGIMEMTEVTSQMVREVLKSFVAADSNAARKVLQMDDAVDKRHRQVINFLTQSMKENTAMVEGGVQILWVSRNIERIADHTTNIAEDIVYMVGGEIIRHQNFEEMEESN